MLTQAQNTLQMLKESIARGALSTEGHTQGLSNVAASSSASSDKFPGTQDNISAEREDKIALSTSAQSKESTSDKILRLEKL